MKRQALQINFHNPNTKAESEVLAVEFIARAAVGVLAKMILERQNQYKCARGKAVEFE